MTPRAKKNLHESAFHLRGMRNATHFEDLEIAFAAFVNAARNVTNVLQKEFKTHEKYRALFNDWYGDGGTTPKAGSKGHQMKSDPLCKFFVELRNSIGKEGINGFACNTHIQELNTGTDLIDRPLNSSFVITGAGAYYLVEQGTGKEDLIPARTKARMTTEIFLTNPNPPTMHLGQKLEKNDVISLSEKYIAYLTELVEEWTEIMNKPDAP
jgi:hypothetical protein